MRRGTTPTVAFRCAIDLTEWDVYVTFEQGAQELTRDDVTIVPIEGGSLVKLTLTQEETLAFRVGEVAVQVRAKKDGEAVASEYCYTKMKDVLKDGVI